MVILMKECQKIVKTTFSRVVFHVEFIFDTSFVIKSFNFSKSNNLYSGQLIYGIQHGHQASFPSQHFDQLLQENYLTESHGGSYLSFLGW